MRPFTLLITAVCLFVSSLATPISSVSRIRHRQGDVLDIPDSVPFRPTATLPVDVTGLRTAVPHPKLPKMAGLRAHGFVTVWPEKREDAPRFSPEALARQDMVAPPELPAPLRGPTNVKSLAFSLHSFLKGPSIRRGTTPEAQQSAQRLTRATPDNSTVPISQETKGVITGYNDIGIKTAAFSGRHSFMKFGG